MLFASGSAGVSASAFPADGGAVPVASIAVPSTQLVVRIAAVPGVYFSAAANTTWSLGSLATAAIDDANATVTLNATMDAADVGALSFVERSVLVVTVVVVGTITVDPSLTAAAAAVRLNTAFTAVTSCEMLLTVAWPPPHHRLRGPQRAATNAANG
jgi:hypothetical protein